VLVLLLDRRHHFVVVVVGGKRVVGRSCVVGVVLRLPIGARSLQRPGARHCMSVGEGAWMAVGERGERGVVKRKRKRKRWWWGDLEVEGRT
jgi:hypothetical protein